MTTVLLVTTHRKAARFVPLVREALAENWPGHPPLRFLTDGGAEGADVIVSAEADFVPLMSEGIARLGAEFPRLTHVFHLLEDHCPLKPCDVARVEAICSLARSRELTAVSFATYDWPWDLPREELARVGAVYGLDRFDVEIIGAEAFAVVPRSFYRYFQVQPTLWHSGYLEQVLRHAISHGVVDPWGFEALDYGEARQHFVSRYRWPTVHHGFLAQGKVHPPAIAFAPARSRLRHALREEIAPGAGELGYRLALLRSWIAERSARLRRAVGGKRWA